MVSGRRMAGRLGIRGLEGLRASALEGEGTRVEGWWLGRVSQPCRGLEGWGAESMAERLKG